MSNPISLGGQVGVRRTAGDPRSVLLSAAVCAAICLLGTWRLDVASMEGIISLGGQHMLRTHEWFVPKLYGEIYAFKPSLAYWLAAAGETLLGSRTEFALRLPFALCAIAWGLVTYAVVAGLAGTRCGLYSALALMFSGLFIEQSRIAGYDVPLALGVGVAMLAAFHCLVRGQTDWRWWMIGYGGLAFGFLAKGLPAVGMFFPGLLLACIVTRQVRHLLRWQHLAGLALFVGLVSAYLLLAYNEQGAAAFGDQWGEIGYRSARWRKGYVLATLMKPLVIVGIGLPWSILLPALAFPRRMPVVSDQARRLIWTAGAFLCAGIVVWMTMTTTSTRYYLPMLTPVAVLAGIAAETLERAWTRSRRSEESGLPSDPPAATRTGFKALTPAVVLAVVGVVYWCAFVGFVEPRRNAARSMQPVASVFASHLPAGAKVHIDTDDGCSSLFYYLKHDVGLWRVNGKGPKSPIYAVLINNQREYVLARQDFHVDVLASCSGPEDRTYTLARVSRRK